MLRTVSPSLYWRRQLRRLQEATPERELRLLPYLPGAEKTAVDVGAARGVYAAWLLRSFARVVAFEPRPEPAKTLAMMAGVLRLPIQVECVALSNEDGTTILRMLSRDLGRSTIERANDLADPDGSPHTEISVETRRLDGYGIPDVGVIKIDVEGHELAVLEGAADTIERCRPSLLVECEERHLRGATGRLFSWVCAKGYEGLFLLGDKLVSVDRFSAGLHQDPENISGWKDGWQRRGTYVNNFIFIPRESVDQFLSSMDRSAMKIED
jgi:FkbM family methyltransferase